MSGVTFVRIKPAAPSSCDLEGAGSRAAATVTGTDHAVTKDESP
jgi:hypothetical protein